MSYDHLDKGEFSNRIDDLFRRHQGADLEQFLADDDNDAVTDFAVALMVVAVSVVCVVVTVAAVL